MSDAAEHLFRSIQASRKELEALVQLCEAELTAIKARDLEQLQQVVADKQAALERFERSVLERNQLLQQAGVSVDASGLEALLSRFPDKQRALLSKGWQALEALLKQVSDLNARNEQVVQRNRKNLDQLLSIMRGQNQRNTLYNQSGGTGNYAAQNSLGKA